MLFLNRRGYATRLQCLKCGYVAECDDCSLAYTYHRTTEHLICHMCGAIRHAPTRCPECGNPEVRYSGLGTQKIETIVRSIFRSAEVVRMDADTMTRKDSYRETLTAFRAGAIDILVGTQMIAKGLHFPNVTLVGVVFADLGLNLPDFRAGERTFQLVVQVAGRAGRGEVPGRVIVQTYTPYHPVIQAALRQDYDGFFETEIRTRQEAGFPPARRLLLMHLQGEDESEVAATAGQLAEAVKGHLPAGSELIPAMPSPIPKKRGHYHYQVLCFTPRIVTLSRRIKQLLSRARPPKGVRISVDVDPYSIL
jgi:primosomal protein N' (replication factor Y)